MKLRTVLAYFIAPLFAVILHILADSESWDKIFHALTIDYLLIIYIISIIFSWLFGAPTHLILKILNKESFLAYLLCGFILGLILSFAILEGSTFTSDGREFNPLS